MEFLKDTEIIDTEEVFEYLNGIFEIGDDIANSDDNVSDEKWISQITDYIKEQLSVDSFVATDIIMYVLEKQEEKKRERLSLKK